MSGTITIEAYQGAWRKTERENVQRKDGVLGELGKVFAKREKSPAE